MDGQTPGGSTTWYFEHREMYLPFSAENSGTGLYLRCICSGTGMSIKLLNRIRAIKVKSMNMNINENKRESMLR